MISDLDNILGKLEEKMGIKPRSGDVSEQEEVETHILFDFIPEDACIPLLKYLEKNYEGSSLKELSSDLNVDKEIMNDHIEILINYGLVFERILKKEKLYSINEGTYYRFVQEIKKLR